MIDSLAKGKQVTREEDKQGIYVGFKAADGLGFP